MILVRRVLLLLQNLRSEDVIVSSSFVCYLKQEMLNLVFHSELQESEDADWMRAEYLVRIGGRAEVELLSSSTRGFVVSPLDLIDHVIVF